MYDHHRRWAARDFYMVEAHTAAQYGVEHLEQDVFNARSRFCAAVYCCITACVQRLSVQLTLHLMDA